MFCQGGAMQLSAANLLIASQQLARPRPAPQTQFASALAQENGAEAAGFEPLAFKQSAPAKAPVPAPPAGYSPSSPLGANIDIRV